MNKTIKAILLNVTLVVMLAASLMSPMNAIAADTVKETDVTTAANGNSLVLVEGTFVTESAQKILSRLNEIRLEACREGITIPGYKKLSTADYVPLKWSADLERYARIRSAELTLNWDHVRPNGNRCFKHEYGFSYRTLGENLAANGSGIMRGIEQYYNEKYDLLNNTGKQTGHYINLINPRFNYVGVGGFKADGGTYYYSAMQLAGASGLSEAKDSFAGAATQKLEIRNSSISSLSLSGSSSVNAGKSVKLTLKGKSNNGLSGIEFSFVSGATYSSSNTSIATVSSTGLVSGKKAGTATITAKAAGKSATFKVTVKGTASTVAVSSVSLNKSSLTLNVNASSTLTATVSPSNATNKTITWSSSDTSVATVNASGKVTAKKAGTATITAKSNNGKTATCKVTVKKADVAVSSLSLNYSSFTLNVGSAKTITATVSPSNATNKTISWSSSNTAVATVDSSGKVTAKKAGTVTITAKSNNGKSATCKVTVTNPTVAVSSLTLNKSSLSIRVNGSATLTATVSPSNATNKTITWSSNNTAVATVDSNGKVSGRKAGTATITAKSNNGKMATCTVTVTNPTVAVSSLSLDRSSFTLKVNESYKLTAVVSPSNATNKTVTWSSSNASVAAVDSTGRVVAYKSGTVTITARSNNGKTAACTVTVAPAGIEVSSISLQYPKLVISKGSAVTVKATVYPDNAADKTISWSSSNASVMTVDANGKVTAHAAGTSELRAEASNGVSSSITVYVNDVNVTTYGIKITKGTTRLQLGEKFRFEAVLYPTSRPQVFNWKSSDTSVATVDSDGNITTRKVGVTYISVSDGCQSCSYELVVFDGKVITPTSVSLNVSSLRLAQGSTYQLTPTVYPFDATVKNVSYSSSDSSVARVNYSTGVITAVGKGTAVITVQTKWGLYKAQCTVTVY